MGSAGRDPEGVVAALRGDLARPEIVFALLHGSFQARGRSRDVDVAIWVDPALVPHADRQRYALDAAARLTVELGTTVDVQVLNDAPLGFRVPGMSISTFSLSPGAICARR